MAMSSNDFIEARKVSLSALGSEEKKKKSGEDELESSSLEEGTELPGSDEMEYIPTSNFLAVRHVAYLTMEEDEKFNGGVVEEVPVNVNEKLYAQAIEGKEAVEREKKQALLDHRG